MAYTSSPQFQTYKTEKVKFDGTPTQRLGGSVARNRDIDILNMYYDRVSQENKEREVFLKKRPGFSSTNYSIGRTGSNLLRGYYYHRESNRLYYAISTFVRSFDFSSGTTYRTVKTLTTSTGYVGFCDFLKSDGTKYVVFTDGQELFVDDYATNTCNQVTDADLPVPHLPFPVYLDGYIFLAKPNTNDFYNSSVDDPFSWVAGDFIQAEMSADSIVRIAKNRNYLMVFGKESLEFFYNAAIASGSPMQRNDSAFKNIGYVSGLTYYGDKIYFVGQEKESNIAVYEIDGFKVNKVSNEIVDRTIQAFSTSPTASPQNNSNFIGGIISCDGHNFYIVRSSFDTWVYDLEEKFWFRWRNSNNNNIPIEAAFTLFNGQCLCVLETESTLSLLSPNNYQDFGINFTVRYTTEDITAGTSNWKTCHRALVVGDQWLDTGTSNLVLSWSDNDWATPSSNFININMFSSSPYTTRLGRFRNRSFRVEYTDNYPLRLKHLEIDLNIGST